MTLPPAPSLLDDLSPGDRAFLSRYREQLDRRADDLTTACVHAGDSPDPATGALDGPIVMASAFGFDSADQAAAAFRGEDPAFVYGRWGNPTVRALEAKLAALEGAEDACATASGMGAIAGALLSLCTQGAHVVAPRSMYAESARLLRERLPSLGITCTFVDPTAAAYEAALRTETRVLYLETPANPTLAITDVAAVVALANARGIVTLADNTFATPFSQTPHALGVDLVVHSLTKAIGGHGDVIGGLVTGSAEAVARVKDVAVKGFGAMLAPHSAWLVSRGARTLALRQAQASWTAAVLARRLRLHPLVAKVHHPSLEEHPGHAIARAQMHAFGSLFSFEFAGDGALSAFERGKRVVGALRLAAHAVSLGDVKTLVVHPASTTHSTMPEPARRDAGVTDGLFRVSVGLESAGALWRDFDAAFAGGTRTKEC